MKTVLDRNTSEPVAAKLTPALSRAQKKWMTAAAGERERIYAEKLAPGFAKLFAKLPLDGAPPGLAHPRALISVLGMSWQPVVLMAAWVKPSRMLIVTTREARAASHAGQSIDSLIRRHAGVHGKALAIREVEADDEAAIYRLVRGFIQREARRGTPAREILVDPTGGKKSMSAAASIAGAITGTLLGYVDYLEYLPDRRTPKAGTEYPRLLANPLEVLGDLEFARIRRAFDERQFFMAEQLAAALGARLWEPREAQALEQLAQGYGAWDRFLFHEAADALKRAESFVRHHGVTGGWDWLPAVNAVLGVHLRLTEQLGNLAACFRAEEKPASVLDAMPLVWNHLAAAHRALASDQPSAAVMLAYSAVERYVSIVLMLDHGWVDGNAAALTGKLDLAKYHELGWEWFGRRYQERNLPGKLTYADGIRLLAAVSTGLIEDKDLGRLKHLADMRNHCEFEHGIAAQPVAEKSVKNLLAFLEELVGRYPKGKKGGAFALADYEFPKLD